MQKNLWKCILMTSRRVNFSYCLKIALNNWMPLIPFRILMDVTVFNSSPMKNQDGALYDKKQVIAGNWPTVVTESFVLNVTGLLDLTLKYIDTFRLRQVLHLSFTCSKSAKRH